MNAPAEPSAPPPGRGPSPLARFVATALLWLPVTFAVWYAVSPALIAVVRLLAAAATLPFGDLVQTVDQSGSTLQFVTSLKPGQTAGGGVVTVSVDGLLYSFGMPMFAALTLAAREPARWRILAIGIAALLPFVTFGAVADLLKNVAITAGPIVASQSGFSAGQREAIAFAYQFGTLILPTVAPAIVWVLSHRAFLERLRAQGPR
ncbi:MAG: exosortase H-associated membrane protein [Burkholderiales bacterium]